MMVSLCTTPPALARHAADDRRVALRPGTARAPAVTDGSGTDGSGTDGRRTADPGPTRTRPDPDPDDHRQVCPGR
jgi:hypothetical protein